MRSFLFTSIATLFASVPAFAQESAGGGHGGSSLAALGAGLAIGIAACGGALGQGRALASAMDGISRNPAAQPKLFIPLLIGLAFVETLVIFSFVIAFQLVGKI